MSPSILTTCKFGIPPLAGPRRRRPRFSTAAPSGIPTPGVFWQARVGAIASPCRPGPSGASRASRRAPQLPAATSAALHGGRGGHRRVQWSPATAVDVASSSASVPIWTVAYRFPGVLSLTAGARRQIFELFLRGRKNPRRPDPLCSAHLRPDLAR